MGWGCSHTLLQLQGSKGPACTSGREASGFAVGGRDVSPLVLRASRVCSTPAPSAQSYWLLQPPRAAVHTQQRGHWCCVLRLSVQTPTHFPSKFSGAQTSPTPGGRAACVPFPTGAGIHAVGHVQEVDSRTLPMSPGGRGRPWGGPTPALRPFRLFSLFVCCTHAFRSARNPAHCRVYHVQFHAVLNSGIRLPVFLFYI